MVIHVISPYFAYHYDVKFNTGIVTITSIHTFCYLWNVYPNEKALKKHFL